MRTRRASNKKIPEIIQIQSEQQSVQEYKNDDSSCSSQQNSDSQHSIQSDNQEFIHLVPINEEKKKKNFQELKNYLLSHKSNSSTNTNLQQIFQRAPVLNLLRPHASKLETEKIQVNQNHENSSIQVPTPPSLSQDSDEQIHQVIQMSLPRKKPKFMEELQKQLNKPAEEYKNDELAKQIQQIRQQRKRENKKRDYLIQKKTKQYKIGKKKDTISNQVFNAIQDFFT